MHKSEVMDMHQNAVQRGREGTKRRQDKKEKKKQAGSACRFVTDHSLRIGNMRSSLAVTSFSAFVLTLIRINAGSQITHDE
jgi:hypothetical protein